jgi:hypothetical protein
VTGEPHEVEDGVATGVEGAEPSWSYFVCDTCWSDKEVEELPI